jgi:hypothetical protein
METGKSQYDNMPEINQERVSPKPIPIDMLYFHGYTADGYRFTIAGVVENDDLILGVAICADGETFSKAKGRTIATGRALNQRQFPRGRHIVGLYTEQMQNEFRGENGFPENYFKGREINIFREFVWNYGFFTKKELQREFSLLKK